MDTIEIALATDEGYVCGLVVTAVSIAMNARRDVALRFHILDCGLSDETYADIVRRVSKWHSSVTFVRYVITDAMLKEFPAWHGGKSAYARLFLQDLIPDAHYVIYCDVDFLWLGDVAELWSLRNEKALISVHDASAETLDAEEAWHKSHGLEFSRETYFCSGLCFMNLDRFREKGYGKAAMDFIARYPDVKYPDQAALNYVLKNDLCLVDGKWQQLTGLLTDEACSHPCVFHYAGDTPWKRHFAVNMITDALLLWHRYYALIYNMTVWQSLHRCFSAGQILYRRALWYAAGPRWSRAIVCWILQIIGKRECANYIIDARKAIKWRCA